MTSLTFPPGSSGSPRSARRHPGRRPYSHRRPASASSGRWWRARPRWVRGCGLPTTRNTRWTSLSSAASNSMPLGLTPMASSTPCTPEYWRAGWPLLRRCRWSPFSRAQGGRHHGLAVTHLAGAHQQLDKFGDYLLLVEAFKRNLYGSLLDKECQVQMPHRQTDCKGMWIQWLLSHRTIRQAQSRCQRFLGKRWTGSHLHFEAYARLCISALGRNPRSQRPPRPHLKPRRFSWTSRSPRHRSGQKLSRTAGRVWENGIEQPRSEGSPPASYPAESVTGSTRPRARSDLARSNLSEAIPDISAYVAPRYVRDHASRFPGRRASPSITAQSVSASGQGPFSPLNFRRS